MTPTTTPLSMIHAPKTKLTVRHIQEMKGKEQIVMFATPDPWLAAAAEAAGVHIVRCWGPGDTDEIRAQTILWTVRELRRAAPNIVLNPYLQPHLVAESDATAIRSSILLMDAGADIILVVAATPQRVEAMAKERIPVFGHVGLRPYWYIEWTGGYVAVGKTAEDALKIFQEAYDLQEAGAAMITIEMTPREITAEVAKRLRIPVISIAAGAGADGAELVYHDLLGISPFPPPRHAKQYRQFFNEAVAALGEFANDVKTRAYPDPEQHSRTMDPTEFERFLEALERRGKR